MVPTPAPSTTSESTITDRTFSPGVSALIGAVAGIVLSFIPLSTVLGGVVAGYLTDGTRNDGMKVGALAGLIMLIPFAFVGLFVIVFFLGVGGHGPPLGFLLMAFMMLVFGALYTVGLSAVGGYLGVYLKDEL